MRGEASDKCFAVATRAALRAFPLMIIYSEGINKEYFPIRSFGFWEKGSVRLHLLSVMRSHCLGIFLVHERLPSYNLLLNIVNAIDNAKYDVYRACESAKKRDISFSSAARSDAFITANLVAFHSIDCSHSLFPCIDTALIQAQSEIVDSIESAAIVAEQASALYSAAVAKSKSLTEGEDFETERAELIDAAVSAAIHTSIRFNRLASFALDVSTDSSLAADASSAFALVVVTATAASEAFSAVALHIRARNLSFFNETFTTAISAAEAYECARLASLVFTVDGGVDMYVGIETQVYESARNALDINFCIAFNEAADAAETMMDAFNLAAKSNGNYANVRSAFDIFRAKHECLYQQCPAAAERIYDAAWNATFTAFDAFLAVDADQKYLHSLPAQNTSSFNDEAYLCAIEAIEAAGRAFNADVAAYSKYKIRAVGEMFEQAVIEDVRFLKSHTASQLLEQPIWLTPNAPVENRSELGAISERDLNPKTMWNDVWQAFKHEALILDSDFHIWLTWYDELFAGKPIEIEKLRSLFERSFEMESAEPIARDSNEESFES